METIALKFYVEISLKNLQGVDLTIPTYKICTELFE